MVKAFVKGFPFVHNKVSTGSAHTQPPSECALCSVLNYSRDKYILYMSKCP